MESSSTIKLKARYGESEHGNFAVVDTIGVPHTYMVGPKHVAHASDYHGGMLGEATLKAVQCAHPRCQLSYAQHETALLVKCKVEMSRDGKVVPELHAYLLKCKPLCEADGRVGFAFMQDHK